MSRHQGEAELLQGTLDMLILQVVSGDRIHGYGISARLARMSREVLRVRQGSLYPALHRLEQRGWLRSEWGIAESGREAKFYTLTAKGRKQLESKRGEWERLSEAIALVLRPASGEA